MANTATTQPDRTVRRRRRAAAASDDATNNNQPAAAAGAAAGATAAAGAAAADAPNDGGPRQFNARSAFREFIFRTALMYFMWNMYAKPKSQAPTDPASGEQATIASPTPTPAAAKMLSQFGLDISGGPTPAYYNKQLSSHWQSNVVLSLRVFTSVEPNMSFAEAMRLPVESALYAHHDLTFDTSQHNYRAENVTLDVPDAVSKHNSSWYAHAFVVRGPIWDIDPEKISEAAVEENVLYDRYNLVTWLDASVDREKKSLLGGDGDEDAKAADTDEKADADAGTKDEKEEVEKSEEDGTQEKEEGPRFRQMWRPTVPVVVVTTTSPIKLAQLPPNSAAMFRVSEPHNSFFPPMHIDDFWTMESSLHRMNETVQTVQLEVSYTPMSLYKWSMYRQFENVWQKQMDFGTLGPKEVDELKRMFVETNPVLLGTTMVVSMIHTVLETLAFKNDISHWKNIKSMEGVSVRSMIWKIVMEAIIFLYLWDNDTSWMITLGNGVGLGIEVWKLTKAVKFENFGKKKLLGFIPWFEMSDRESYSKETKEYDEQAMKYLSYAVLPLVAGYAMYSLRYEKHRSWYSWVINSLVGAVYAFGFIMMFPQIFINYKLKSVAHIPMKAMMYKTLNTIIDDLFSFIIKMPWLHRLACFRDDVVFLIILYQRWIYPVDTTRVNEFGQRFDENGNEIVGEGKDENKDGDKKKKKKKKNEVVGEQAVATVDKCDGEGENQSVADSVSEDSSKAKTAKGSGSADAITKSDESTKRKSRTEKKND